MLSSPRRRWSPSASNAHRTPQPLTLGAENCASFVRVIAHPRHSAAIRLQPGHMVNQYLANITSDGTAIPRLLAELPAVDKGTWQVFPDGKMEVTYKVRPGVKWHDGTPFTADDIAFSWEVGRDPNIANGNQG